MDILAAIHMSGSTGEISGTIHEMCRICHCSPGEMTAATSELKATGTADVTEGNGKVIFCNRRMRRDFLLRKSNAVRKKRYDDRNRNGECNAEVTGEKSEDRDQSQNQKMKITPLAKSPPTSAEVSSVASEAKPGDSWDDSGGDKLDMQIRIACKEARYLLWSPKVHSDFRRIAEAVGFDEAKKLIAAAATGPDVISPTAVALSRLGQTQARQLAGPPQTYTDQSRSKTRAAFAKASERMGGAQ